MNDQVFRKKIYRILLLAFFPVSVISDEFTTIKFDILREGENDNIKNFINYFEKTHIRNNEPIGDRNEGLFALESWSVYWRVKNSIPRTSNSAEAWNRGLNRVIPNAHPNIAQLINILVEKEQMDTYKLIKSDKGDFEWNSINYDLEMKIQKIVNSYDILTKESYFNLLLRVIKFDFN